MRPWEAAGVSRTTWYRRRSTDLDLQRRAATTPAEMTRVLRAALPPGAVAGEIGLGLLADILLRWNAGEASASELAIATKLLREHGLLGVASPADDTAFAEFE